MRRQLIILASVSIVVLITASIAQAQFRGGPRIGITFGSGGYGPGGYGPGGYYGPGYYGPYSRPRSGFGVDVYNGNVYPYFNYSTGPRYYGSRYDYYPGYSTTYVPYDSPRVYYAEPVPPPPPDNTARIRIRVPEGANVFFDGQATKQSGPMREFQSPTLEPGYDYHFEVRADWSENGEAVSATRQITFQAGDRLTVDFTSPAPAGQADQD